MSQLSSPRRVVTTIVAGAALAGACAGGSSPTASEVSTAVTSPPAVPTQDSTNLGSATTTLDATTTTAPALEFSAAVTGAEEMVFDWSEDQCAPGSLPDLPTQAFRDSSGNVNLILSAPTIHRMVGPDFDSLQVDCDPIRRSGVNPDPSQYDFQGWLGSLYTEDGVTINAVIHNEFHGDDASFASSQRDFSDQSGFGGWAYVGRAGAEEELTFANGEWRRGDTLCSVANWGSHPDNDCEAVRRWTAPESGDVSVWVSVADAGVGGGDGVDVGIRHEGAEVWSLAIEEGDQEPTEVNVEISVAAGDEVDFWVNSRGDASFDATQFLIEINYGERPCDLGDRDACFMTSLTSAVSIDGGATFETSGGSRKLIATVPERYVPDGGSFGLWQPSNIVKHPSDGYYYMFSQIDVHQGSLNVSGLCLLRTDDLSDATSWRAWDGEGFGYQFLDPYVDDTSEVDACPSVLDAPGWSLTYNTFLERFVIVSELPRSSPPGVYFRTSEDLIHWSPPELIFGPESWKIGFANDFETPFEAYPSILDPTSGSMSFDTVGETAYVYFTRINSYSPLDFDLLRTPIRFEK